MTENNRNEQVSLGCGTLILIALIVLTFSGGTDDLEREVRNLKKEVTDLTKEVGTLNTAISNQSTEIRNLRERLPAPAAEAD